MWTGPDQAGQQVDWASSPGWHVGVGLDHSPLARQVLTCDPTML